MWPHNRAFLWTVYSLGLRLQEGLALELGDIDSARMLVHVHRGKGAKDRFVPLPARTLAKLRDHWATHRHPRLSFPALGRARNSPAKPSSGSCGSSQAIRALAADRRFFGDAQPGFFGVLDTWDRALGYHPHVHYVVPGEAVAADVNSWITSGPAFFLPLKALSILFRAKFREELRKAGLLEEVDPAVWKRDWVVHSKAVGDSRTSLKYLATYMFRVGISVHRIVACANGQVTFSYRKSGSNRWRRMTLDAMEFIRRFLQHVLPKGLQKVRHYGFLGARAPISIEAVRWLVTLNNGKQFLLLAKTAADTPALPTRRCGECGEQLRVVAIFPRLPTVTLAARSQGHRAS